MIKDYGFRYPSCPYEKEPISINNDISIEAELTVRLFSAPLSERDNLDVSNLQW